MCDQVHVHTSLGNIAKSVDALEAEFGKLEVAPGFAAGAFAEVRRMDGRERRRERYRLQEFAARLLPEGHRSSRCGRRLASGRGAVRLVVASDDEGSRRASYHNVETCANVWACPVCSARISEGRRRELNTLLAWARERGFAPYLVTLTLRHAAGESLAAVLQVLKDAKRRFHQSRAWRVFPAVGHVTATEVTYGEHGWHPHVHMIIILPASCPAVAWLEQLRPVWEAALQAAGGYGNGYAYQVQEASAAGDYVTKWGAASEMTLAGHKSGRAGSRGVWQLLADAGAGDVDAGRLWLEYTEAFRGVRQLVWSRRLKAAVGLLEVDDSELLADIESDESAAAVEAIEIGPNLWAQVLYAGLRAQVLDIAEVDLDTCAEFLANIGLQAGLESIEVEFV